jgi:hypothetical protein
MLRSFRLPLIFSLLLFLSAGNLLLAAVGEDAETGQTIAINRTELQKTVAAGVKDSVALRYVSGSGNDANDGLSWANSKHTIYGALTSLPGGSNFIAGSGTIYVAPGSLANPNTNTGIWLMGRADPNYNNPPVGWLKCNGCTTNIVGIPNYASGPNGHKNRVLLEAGGSADNSHPAIWISGTQQPQYIANLGFQYPGRAVVIGECSNGIRTGTCGVSGVVLDNVSSLITTRALNGPCTDITGGSFWIWMRDYGCGGNAVSASGGRFSDHAAAILIDGRGNTGNGLIYIKDSNIAGGGVKVIPGSNGTSVYVDDLIEEGDYVHDIPPVVLFTK